MYVPRGCALQYSTQKNGSGKRQRLAKESGEHEGGWEEIRGGNEGK
jgi:hypothetical protein